MSDFYPDTPIVTTQWLNDHLTDPRVRIVDIRGLILPPDQPKPHYFPKRQEYLQAHLPGAVFVDWTVDIVDLDDPVPVQIAPPDKFAAFMSAIGVGDDTLVVGYDDHRSALAARLWWALRYYGHDAVRILDGGWHKWVGECRATTAELTGPQKAIFHPHLRPEMRKTADDVLAAVAANAVCLLDARTSDEFAGKLSRAKRSGHISGAVSLPALEVVAGTYEELAPAEELRLKFARYAGEGKLPIITYCNGGVSAALLLAGMEMAGIEGSLYDGSWGEWGNDLRLPIA